MIRCPVRNITHRDVEKDSVEMGQKKSCFFTAASNRKVLANYLEQLNDNKGWWYRMPEYKFNTDKMRLRSKIDSDKMMPHFGSLFGLTEEASAIILVEMGCLRLDKVNKKNAIVNKGWEDLANKFKLQKKVEVTPTKIRGQRRFYIRLGTPPKEYNSPSMMYKAFEKKK